MEFNIHMKHILYTLLILAISPLAFAQQTIPVDEETKLAYYKEVVEVPGATRAELYDRGLAWINKFFPNPNGVIQSKNPETGEIVGKAQFKLKLVDKKGVETFEGMVAYTFTMSFKDGKFKYEITRIHWVQASYYDVSKWNDTKDPHYKSESYPAFIQQTNSYFDNMKAELKKAVKTAPVKKKDDW